MEFVEAKQEIVILRAELAELDSEYKEYRKNFEEIGKKMRLCERNRKDLIRQIKIQILSMI